MQEKKEMKKKEIETEDKARSKKKHLPKLRTYHSVLCKLNSNKKGTNVESALNVSAEWTVCNKCAVIQLRT